MKFLFLRMVVSRPTIRPFAVSSRSDRVNLSWHISRHLLRGAYDVFLLHPSRIRKKSFWLSRESYPEPLDDDSSALTTKPRYSPNRDYKEDFLTFDYQTLMFIYVIILTYNKPLLRASYYIIILNSPSKRWHKIWTTGIRTHYLSTWVLFCASYNLLF